MLSAWIVCSKLIARLALVIAAGSVVALALSPVILSMVRAVRAPSFLTWSSLASRRTPNYTNTGDE